MLLGHGRPFYSEGRRIRTEVEPEQYPWLDVKPSGGLPVISVYQVEGTHGVPRRARAFSCNSSLRITATRATLPGFPRWRRF